jgi:hypothetical protein
MIGYRRLPLKAADPGLAAMIRVIRPHIGPAAESEAHALGEADRIFGIEPGLTPPAQTVSAPPSAAVEAPRPGLADLKARTAKLGYDGVRLPSEPPED